MSFATMNLWSLHPTVLSFTLCPRTRDLVAQSVAAYADFFRRFDDPKPLAGISVRCFL